MTEHNLLSTHKTLAQLQLNKSFDLRKYRLSNYPEENDPIIVKDMLIKNTFMHKDFNPCLDQMYTANTILKEARRSISQLSRNDHP